MPVFSHLQVRNPKDDETAIEASTQIFASLLPSHLPIWKRLFMKVKPRITSFELFLLNQTIYYYITLPSENETYIMSLLGSSYQKSRILTTPDPMDTILKAKYVEVGEMVLSNYYYLPMKTYLDFSKVDPMASLIGFLAKQEPGINIGIQLLIGPSSYPWQSHAIYTADHFTYNKETSAYGAHPQKSLIMVKAAHQGGKAALRLIASSDTTPPMSYLHNLAGTYGSFSLGEGNQLKFRRPRFTKERLINRIKHRTFGFREHHGQVLNVAEMATLWHPSGKLLSGIKNIAWGKTLGGEPPENLPAATNVTEDEKKDINFFAKTEFKNQETIFGIKTVDRRKHVYIIGKTGAGKSTLISNMAVDDIRKGRGVGIIDPHGDLSEAILEYIPNRRVNDVVYLEPFDTERPFSLNVLEIKNKQHKDLIASGIVSIFFKLYGYTWGPRLEYILRNVIITLLEIPNATLFDGLRILSDAKYRIRVVQNISDPVIKNFWENEFAGMTDRLRTEAISPIQNKVGQFLSSTMVRNIVGVPHSTINLEQIMNDGKILILNLSQGKFGEDNAALLGAMMITQIQLAAMNRAFIKEEDRRDFFLYVDEFQNFATTSFIKILSEARKYRLALTLANQYADQLEEGVRKAIFGNAGTLITFVVGAADALSLQSEFAQIYTQNDLVSLGKHEIITKLSVDNMTSFPFPAKTLPPPSLVNDNKEKIVRLSKEKFGRKVEVHTDNVIVKTGGETTESQPRDAKDPQQREYRSESHGQKRYQSRSDRDQKFDNKTRSPRVEGSRSAVSGQQSEVSSASHNPSSPRPLSIKTESVKPTLSLEEQFSHLPPSLRPRVAAQPEQKQDLQNKVNQNKSTLQDKSDNTQSTVTQSQQPSNQHENRQNTPQQGQQFRQRNGNNQRGGDRNRNRGQFNRSRQSSQGNQTSQPSDKPTAS